MPISFMWREGALPYFSQHGCSRQSWWVELRCGTMSAPHMGPGALPYIKDIGIGAAGSLGVPPLSGTL